MHTKRKIAITDLLNEKNVFWMLWLEETEGMDGENGRK